MAASTLTSFDDTTKLDDWSIRVRLMEILSGVFLTDIGRYALIHELSNYFGLLRYSNSCVDPVDFTEKICCFMRSFHQKGVVDTTVNDFHKTGLCSSGANLYLTGEVLKLAATSGKFEHPELLPGLLHTVFYTVTGAQIPDTTPSAPDISNKKHNQRPPQDNKPCDFVSAFDQAYSTQGTEPLFAGTKPRTPKQNQDNQPSDNDIKITRTEDRYYPAYGVWTRNNFVRPVGPFVRQDKSLRPRTVFHIDIPASLGMDANEVQAAIEELLGSLKKSGLDQQPEPMPQEFFDDLTAAGKVEALIQDFSAANPRVVFTNDESQMVRQHLLQWIQSYPKPLTLGEVVDLSNKATQRIWEILAGMVPGKPIGVKAENEMVKDAAESSAAVNTGRTEPQERFDQIYSWAQELIRSYLAKHQNAMTLSDKVMLSDKEKHLHHDLVMWMSQRPIPKTPDQFEDYIKIAERKIEDLIFVMKSSQTLKKANASLNSATELRAARHRADQFNTQVKDRTAQEVQMQLLDELLYQARTLSSQVNDLCSTTEKVIAELRQMIPLKEAEYFQRNQKPTL